MEYRTAVLADLDALSNLRVDMLDEGSELSQSQKLMIQTNTKQFLLDGLADHSVISWIAVEPRGILGMGCVNFFLFPPNDWCPNGKTAYIGNLYTLPGFRGKGIASNILSRLIAEAKSRQCQRVLLNTSDMARHFYEKRGFEAADTAMAYFPFGIRPH